MLQLSWVRKIAYIYLAIPAILFFFGWLNVIPAMIFVLITILGIFFLLRSDDRPDKISLQRRDVFWGMFILILWLFLSGIGGYAFQNWDHHSRNAVFRDLINYSWPVVYKLNPETVIGFTSSNYLLLSYYFGFWLPSALVGKVAGWGAANFLLFAWSLAGLVLSIILIANKVELSLVKTTLLLVFFSGIDAVGVLLLKNIQGYSYPLLWPPIQHLEWWAGSLQYTSFTTELFWTFNQFIPTLLIMSLLVTATDSQDAIFLGGLSLFYAPIPALGVSIFIGGIMLKDIVGFFVNRSMQLAFSYLTGRLLTFVNLSGLLIGGISLIFYSTNLSVQLREFGLRVPILLYVIFLLVEGILLWFLLLAEYRNDWMWYVAGILLVLAPFIKLGESWDFMMRFTLPSLIILMIGSGRFLSSGRNHLVRLALLALLILGALTPLYEVNRSVVRFERYYRFPYLSAIDFDNYFQRPPETNQLFVPEFDHIETLVADDWVTVAYPNSEGWITKVGNLFDAKYKFLWQPPLIFNGDSASK